jgi:hypothetical protein
MQAVTAMARQWGLGALLALLAGTAFAQGLRDRLVGTWRGTSLCLDRAALPACADEQVVYDIGAPTAEPDVIIVKADKIVEGRRVPMGEVSFRPDVATGRWVSEIETPNVHALWHLALRDGALRGGMLLLPSTTAVRIIELKRVQGSE